MTLPVPAPTAPLADTYKHINDLRAAAVAAINAVNYVTIDNLTVAANVNGDWTIQETGLTTVQGIVLKYRGASFVSLVVNGLFGNAVTGTIYVAQEGSNRWANSPWGPGNFSVYGFAWGVK